MSSKTFNWINLLIKLFFYFNISLLFNLYRRLDYWWHLKKYFYFSVFQIKQLLNASYGHADSVEDFGWVRCFYVSGARPDQPRDLFSKTL